MNRFNKIMLGSLAAILLTAMTVEPPKLKVYLIMSYRGNDLTIEKVYLKKENSTNSVYTVYTNYYRAYYNCDGKIINTTKN